MEHLFSSHKLASICFPASLHSCQPGACSRCSLPDRLWGCPCVQILRYRESRTGAVEALVTSGCLTWTHTPQSLIVATIEMTVCGGCTPKSLWASYRSALAKHPVKTQALTTALLWSIGDIFSQFIEDNEVGS